MVIYSEVERTVLLPDKKDAWASGRLRRTDELVVEVLVQELSKGQLFETSERESIGPCGVVWSIRSIWWSCGRRGRKGVRFRLLKTPRGLW